ncbi:NADH-quinone oxidoreductase subunit J [bacterium]|nr:NADH-quinone oxidoreductase subunit J [bacterium]
METSLPAALMLLRNVALLAALLAAAGLLVNRLDGIFRQLLATAGIAVLVALLAAPLAALGGKLDWSAALQLDARILVGASMLAGFYLLNLMLFNRLPAEAGLLRVAASAGLAVFVISSLLFQPLVVNLSNMLILGLVGGTIACVQLSLHRFHDHRRLLAILTVVGFIAFFWGMLALSVPALRLLNFFFWLFTAGVVGGGIGCVTMRNVFHSALMLILSLFGVAGYFILLNAEFLAMVQVIIYIGGIMVLFLFGIMVSQNIIGTELRQNTDLSPWAALLCTMLFGFMALVGMFMQFPQNTEFPPSAAVLTSNTQAIGWSLMATYTLPFEVASVLLLMAMLGAIILVRKD